MSSGNDPILGAYGVTYAYPGGATIVREVSIELYRSQITTLIGPNGCGKSTLMKVLSGVLPLREAKASSGQIRYLGQDFLAMDSRNRARAVAYVGADFRAEFPLTAYEAVMMGRTCGAASSLFKTVTSTDQDAIQSAMEKCLCWGLRQRELSTLSGGERQLVALARAMAQGAKVLFLDESLSKMDLNHQAAMGRLLKNLANDGYSVLLVSHDLNLASEWADTCVVMKRGEQIKAGPTREVLTTDLIRTIYPSADLIVGESPATGAPKVFFR